MITFDPPAAPIIYSFFLLTVMLYVYLRRPAKRGPRGVMYRVLHDLGEVIDHDLQPGEKAQLTAQLQEVIQTAPGTNLSLLAEALLKFLDTESLYLSERLPRWQQHVMESRLAVRRRLAASRASKRNFRLALAALLAISGGLVVSRLVLVSFDLFVHGGLAAWAVEIMRSGQVASPGVLRWNIIRIVLEGGFGLLMVFAGGLLIARREALAVRLAAVSLVMPLTTVNLLVFYLDQFSAVATALAEFGLLLLTLVYRRWYVEEDEEAAV
jgi:hypothetical protein